MWQKDHIAVRNRIEALMEEKNKWINRKALFRICEDPAAHATVREIKAVVRLLERKIGVLRGYLSK